MWYSPVYVEPAPLLSAGPDVIDDSICAATALESSVAVVSAAVDVAVFDAVVSAAVLVLAEAVAVAVVELEFVAVAVVELESVAVAVVVLEFVAVEVPVPDVVAAERTRSVVAVVTFGSGEVGRVAVPAFAPVRDPEPLPEVVLVAVRCVPEIEIIPTPCVPRFPC